MTDRYLIAFDLDGTVLPSIRGIDERTVSAIVRAREAGHIPVIASARHFGMMRWVYDIFGLNTPVCAINGACVFHPADPAFRRFERSIPRELTAKLLAVALAEGCIAPMYIELNEAVWYAGERHNSYYQERIATSEPAARFDFSALPDTPASRVVLTPPDIGAAERIRTAADGFGGLFAAAWDFVPGASGAGGIRMSVCPAGVDKWHGVKLIADYYGIPVNNIYAFGDMWNDFMMLERAGHGFALKGSDAERSSGAKNVTRYTCAECGVADVIEREILA